MTYDGILISLVDLQISIRPSGYYPDTGPAIIKQGQQYSYHIGIAGNIYAYAGYPHKWAILRNGEYTITKEVTIEKVFRFQQ